MPVKDRQTDSQTNSAENNGPSGLQPGQWRYNAYIDTTQHIKHITHNQDMSKTTDHHQSALTGTWTLMVQCNRGHLLCKYCSGNMQFLQQKWAFHGNSSDASCRIPIGMGMYKPFTWECSDVTDKSKFLFAFTECKFQLPNLSGVGRNANVTVPEISLHT